MRNVTFITGNQNKADYFSRQMGVDIPHVKVELEELQSLDLHEIVGHKLRQAYQVVNGPVLVEDVSLEFVALNGLPGPYIKWFVDHAGSDACCKMLDGFTNRFAIIRCTFGYYDGERMEFFDSELNGTISKEPRGANGFGFDTFFIMDGYTETRAELSQEEVEKTNAEIARPYAQVRNFIENEL